MLYCDLIHVVLNKNVFQVNVLCHLLCLILAKCLLILRDMAESLKKRLFVFINNLNEKFFVLFNLVYVFAGIATGIETGIENLYKFRNRKKWVGVECQKAECQKAESQKAQLLKIFFGFFYSKVCMLRR